MLPSALSLGREPPAIRKTKRLEVTDESGGGRDDLMLIKTKNNPKTLKTTCLRAAV